MSVRDFTERDIHLALDSELPVDERDAYAAWLDANPDMKARSLRLANDMAMIRQAVDGVLSEPVPDHLARMVADRGAVQAASSSTWWRAGAAAAILLVGLAAGYAAGSAGWRPDDRQALAMADSAIAAHDVYAAEKLHVVEVGADQKEHLLGWLSRRLGTTLVAPDLTAHGYQLIGGRLLPAAEKSAAQFMYQDHAGERISLYVARDSSNRETGFRFVQEGSTRALYWLDEGYGCAIAGTVPEETLTAIANTAYEQLFEGMKS